MKVKIRAFEYYLRNEFFPLPVHIRLHTGIINTLNTGIINMKISIINLLAIFIILFFF